MTLSNELYRDLDEIARQAIEGIRDKLKLMEGNKFIFKYSIWDTQFFYSGELIEISGIDADGAYMDASDIGDEEKVLHFENMNEVDLVGILFNLEGEE